MQLKSRQLVLFILASAVLIYSKLSGGSLIAMAVLLQMALLIHKIPLTKKSQMAAFKLFLLSIPLFWFWGAIHSFTWIYLKEKQFLYFISAASVNLLLCFLISYQIVFPFRYLQQADFNINRSLQQTFRFLKSNSKTYLKTSVLIFIVSFTPGLGADWQLVLSVMVIFLYLNWSQLKTAILNY